MKLQMISIKMWILFTNCLSIGLKQFSFIKGANSGHAFLITATAIVSGTVSTATLVEVGNSYPLLQALFY